MNSQFSLLCRFVLFIGATTVIQAGQFGDFTYRLINDGTEVEITRYPEQATGAVEIPQEIFGRPVTSIGYAAFYKCENITGVTIPDSVDHIESSAFNSCGNLTAIVIPDNVINMGDYVFDDCSSLASIQIGKNVTRIGSGVFDDCVSLERIVIPDSVTSIGDSAFEHCRKLESVVVGESVGSIEDSAFDSCYLLTNVNLPASVASLGEMVFESCFGLTSINVDAGNTHLRSVNGVLYSSDLTELIVYPLGRNGTFAIPDNVTSIRSFAFFSCPGLSRIVIPDSVTHIGVGAFAYCSGLASVVVPGSVVSIDFGAFYSCNNLTKFYFAGNHPATFGTSVFEAAPADFEIYYLDTASGFTSPMWNGYPTVEIDTSLFNHQFINGGTEIEITGYPTSSVGPVAIPPAIGGLPVTRIGNNAFENCTSVTSFHIPDTVTSLGQRAFYSCESLTSILLPNGTTSIEAGAFESCVGLTVISLPAELTTIENNAFENCSNLMRVYFPSDSPATFESDVFSGAHADFAIYYADTASGFTTPIWNGYPTIQIDTSHYTYRLVNSNKEIEIINYAADVSGEVNIPKEIDGLPVTRIGANALFNRNGLTRIVIPESVVRVGNNAFRECRSLGSAIIPDSVAFIGDEAFRYCSSLTGVNLPTGLTSIRGGVFEDCINLTSITIPIGVTTIGGSAFERCYRLMNVILPDGLSSIGSDAFRSCTNLVSITLPSSLVEIGDSAFEYCNNLSNMEIPANVDSVGDKAFSDCGNLTGVFFAGNSPAEFGSGVFDNTGSNFTIYYFSTATGFTSPTWMGYPAEEIAKPQFSYQIINGGTEVMITDYPENAVGPLFIPTEIEALPVTGIGYEAFSNCSGLTSISIPDSVVNIEGDAFRYCSGLTSIVLPSGLTNIADGLFFKCSSLSTVNIPNNVTHIGHSAFGYCESLASVYLGDSITSIGEFAFSYCYSLTTVDLPAELNVLGRAAFWYCRNLQSIHVEPANIWLTSIEGVLFNGDATELVSYPAGRSGSYSIPPSVTSIAIQSFSASGVLTDVSIPDTVTEIGDWAFANCSSLTTVLIPNSVTSIGWLAFVYCHGLENIYVDTGNVQFSSIEGVLFNASMTDLIQYPPGRIGDYTIPSTVTSIGEHSFFNCHMLTSVIIPKSLKNIGRSAFYGCSSLTRAYFKGNSPEMLGSEIFRAGFGFTIYYFDNALGFSSPTWMGYPAVEIDTSIYTHAPWLIEHGQAHDAIMSIDVNGDGVPLLVAYALMLDPTEDLSASLPVGKISGGKLELTFFAGRPDINYKVYASSDLIYWSTTGVTLSDSDVDGYRTASVSADFPAQFLNLTVEEQ